MTAIEEQYKHLRLNNEIRPLLRRYGIQYDPKAKKAELLQLLLENGVPLDRVQQSATTPDLNTLPVLGLTQIDRDYPALGSDESSSGGMDEDSGGGSGDGSGDGMDEDSSGGSNDGSGDGIDEDSGGSGDRSDDGSGDA
jgi:hypothetical protein